MLTRTPVLSLAAAAASVDTDGGNSIAGGGGAGVAAGQNAAAPTPGLPFHQHNANWLTLLAGAKQWYTVPSDAAAPVSAHSRVPAATLARMFRGAAAQARGWLRCRQLPGETVYLPPYQWHATYNVKPEGAALVDSGGREPSPVVLAVGGLGPWVASRASFAAVTANVALLKSIHAAAPAELDATNAGGESVIHHAAAPAALEWLIQHGIDPNRAVDDTDLGAEDAELTPLHLAASRDDTAAMSVLAAHGGDLTARSKSGMGAAHHAVLSDATMAIRWLGARGAGGDSATGLAARDRNGMTPLLLAVDSGRPHTTLEALRMAGCDVHARVQNPGDAWYHQGGLAQVMSVRAIGLLAQGKLVQPEAHELGRLQWVHRQLGAGAFSDLTKARELAAQFGGAGARALAKLEAWLDAAAAKGAEGPPPPPPPPLDGRSEL